MRRRSSQQSRLMIAPMIDIVFQLLAFFIFALGAGGVSQQIETPMALGRETSRAIPSELVIEITSDQRVIIGDATFALGDAQTPDRLNQVLQDRGPEDPVVIRADRACPYASVDRVLEQLRHNQITSFVLRLRIPAE